MIYILIYFEILAVDIGIVKHGRTVKSCASLVFHLSVVFEKIFFMRHSDETMELTEKIGAIRTAMLHDLNENNSRLPMIAKVLLVEQDGQLWLEVKTKVRNWNVKQNLPIRLQFSDDNCQIDISGIGRFVTSEQLPIELQKDKLKPVMRVKPQFGEYIPLPALHSRRRSIVQSAQKAYKQLFDIFLGRSDRRLLIFH